MNMVDEGVAFVSGSSLSSGFEYPMGRSAQCL